MTEVPFGHERRRSLLTPVADGVREGTQGREMLPMKLRVLPVKRRVLPVKLRALPMKLRVLLMKLRVLLTKLRVLPTKLRVLPMKLRRMLSTILCRQHVAREKG